MQKLKIAILAPFEEPVPPTKYGGTELVVYNLITELVKRGHDVTLFGTGDSTVPCRVVPLFPKSLRSLAPYDAGTSVRDAGKIVGIGKMLSLLQAEHFDIVHNHQAWQVLAFKEFIPSPIVTTLHEQLYPLDAQVGYTSFTDLQYVSISNNQRLGLPGLTYIDTVYNGIDLSLFPFVEIPDPRKYLVFLGRVSIKKGLKEAIQIAKSVQMPLYIMAKPVQIEMDYWKEVQSMMDGKSIIDLGEVDVQTKIQYLSGAYAMLSPIQWEEPFGLNVVEAMACGTPVLGLMRGSYAEIVDHGKTGFLAKTVEELVSFVSKIPEISRIECRKVVEKRFTKEMMAEGYERVYEKVIGDASAR